MSYAAQNTTAYSDVLRYARQKRLSLAAEIGDRRKVYLDTKYWVLLRDVRLGRQESSDVVELLGKLESGVETGLLICPFNAEILFEILKQNDRTTFDATVQLIDDLSLGVCILPRIERLELEILHLLESTRKRTSSIYTLDQLAWTKTCYVLGFVAPESANLSIEKYIEIQKSFCDYLWDIKLSEFLDQVDFDKIPNTSLDISQKLNKEKFAHSAENASFNETFMSEVAGLLEEQSEMFADLIEFLYQRELNCAPDKESYDTSAGKDMARILTEGFKLGNMKGRLPSTTILASLHAAVRWDRNRKFKPGDLVDFGHAAAALPYCDIFLTERSLSALIRDRSLGFQDMFRCKTVFRPCDALELIDL